MAKLNFLLHNYIFIAFITSIISMTMEAHATDEDRKVYIVYLGSLPQGEFSPLSQHHSILEDVLEGSSSAESLVRSYKRSFNGFAAKLTDKEREKLADREDVVSVFPNERLQLKTTRSWDFMGFTETVKRKPNLESDVIIGLIDTGIWPELDIFKDEGFGPPPKKWKGVCSGGKNFTCNNKVIGARFYNSHKDPDNSARDVDGHGSHTASTAAGNRVDNASFYGLAKGIARGGAPSARIVVYKVCFQLSGCEGADIMAAFDDAISDGVDILSVSLGPSYPAHLHEDPIAIGSYHAMAGGILTVNAAGNDGPGSYSGTSLAPWMVTVAASTIDRQFTTKVVLGNGTTLVGQSINSFTTDEAEYPLVYGKDASTCSDQPAKWCSLGCIDKSLVKGKIVLCKSDFGYSGAYKAGAPGSIGADESGFDLVVPLPSSALSFKDFSIVESYYNSTKKPRAKILKSEEVKDSSAPVVASFSSPGPNILIREILKPDLTAPGANILAAYSPVATPSGIDGDKRSAEYNILSGTSMSCPHVAGIAAYVKSFHPAWSASAIKSALMTSAHPMNPRNITQDRFPEGEFNYGSGHVDPIKARNPGLVYDAVKEDYVKMLCTMGYDTKKLRLISGDNSTTCPKDIKGSPKDFNYPAMAARVKTEESFEFEFPRTVTNVGRSNCTYEAKVITRSSRVKVQVKPNILTFKTRKEKKSFVVSVSGKGLKTESPMASATLVWADGTHIVRSPIVVFIDVYPKLV